MCLKSRFVPSLHLLESHVCMLGMKISLILSHHVRGLSRTLHVEQVAQVEFPTDTLIDLSPTYLQDRQQHAMPPNKANKKTVSRYHPFIVLIVVFPGLRNLRMGGADCVADCVWRKGRADCVAPLVHLQLTVSLEIFAALTVSRSNTAPIPYVPTRFFRDTLSKLVALCLLN
jgi:hypothetical protein